MSKRSPTSKPFIPFSRMNAVWRSPVAAKVTNTDPFEPLPMKRFSPFRIQEPSGCSSARDCIPCTSEPASGSVSAKPASLRPLARSGRKRSFCSSVPNSTMPFMPIDWCTPITTDKVASIGAKTSETRQ